MQEAPTYGDVVDDVKGFLAERIEFATAEGVAEERIWVDPGIGFGKTVEHNLELLRRLGELRRARPADRGRRPPARASSASSRAARSVTGSAARSPPTCWRCSAGRRCSAGARRRRGAAGARRRRGDPGAVAPGRGESRRLGRRGGIPGTRAGPWRRTATGLDLSGPSRSRSAASRSTPITGSPRPSARSGSGSRSTSPSTSPTAMRCSPTGSRTRSTTPRSATSSRWRQPSAATGRSSACAT